MAMLKKKTKAAEKKAAKKDVKAAREKEQSREAHKGKGGAKPGHGHVSHTGNAHAKEGKGISDSAAALARAKPEKAAPEVPAAKKDIKELEADMASLDILKYPLVTEKAVGMIEAENKLTFVVPQQANKSSVKKAVEGLYKVRVTAVNMLRDMKARKRAIVTLDKKFKAADVATKLGVI